jgi:hypothetical protein
MDLAPARLHHPERDWRKSGAFDARPQPATANRMS